MSQSQTCGGNITDESGVINYPDANHEQRYGNNEDCWWRLIADDNKKMEISFSYMDIQKHDRCAYDYLEVCYHPY